MGVNSLKEKLVSIVKKYKYAVVIVLIGLVLIMIPSRTTSKDSQAEQTINEIKHTEMSSVSEELAQILCQIDNAGKVEVLLTVESGEVTVYQTDDELSSNDNNTSTRINTVLVTGSDRDEYGLVRQINPPVYKGAVVVCQGAEDPRVRLAIVDAVATATGLGADRISVLKMK